MQKFHSTLLSACDSQWRTAAEIRDSVSAFLPCGYPASKALILLFRFEDAGLVEMKKEVVEGKNGGELVWRFRRRVGKETR